MYIEGIDHIQLAMPPGQEETAAFFIRESWKSPKFLNRPNSPSVAASGLKAIK